LVATTRQSQTIYYALAKGPALQIMEVLYTAFCGSAASKKYARKAKEGAPKRT